ncbi:copper-binding protein [Phenylobacterium sp.]|jgi:Cu/Ag efflux protein CusF|uniref:copper-binding protein n=1 Tax=Phenylobacterium sp. TaxID=1871053 RepID=UPI002F41B8A0
MISRYAVVAFLIAPLVAAPALASAQPSSAPAGDATTRPPRNAQGTGVVTAVDPAGGTVTLKHDPIPALGWPSMTMDFKAAPALIAKLKVGEKIAFDVNEGHIVPEITAARKR